MTKPTSMGTHSTGFSTNQLSRRSFLALSAAAPFALRSIRGALAPLQTPPLGIELYSVRNALKQDPEGTVRAVAQLGYKGVEFYSPYFEWTEEHTKSMRKLLDDLGIWCRSTHNDASYLSKDNLAKARDRNSILGAKYVVVASAKPAVGPDGRPGDWNAVADLLNAAADGLAPSGLKTGYHNHEVEFQPVDGKRPIETIAAKTTPAVMLQLDIGTCIQAGSDPVVWIKKNPGRIHSLHLKDFSPEAGKDFKVLFGEGVAKWKEIFAAAESTGGAEYYLMEQEGSRLSELDTAKACLETYNNLRA
jgi:sugar phosphate isomerase/epimerase